MLGLWLLYINWKLLIVFLLERYCLGNIQDQEALINILNEGCDLDEISEDEEEDIYQELQQNLDDLLEQCDDEDQDDFPETPEVPPINDLENESPNVPEEQRSGLPPYTKRNLLWKDLTFNTIREESIGFLDSDVRPESENPIGLPIEYYHKYFPEHYFENSAKFTNMYALPKGAKTWK